MEYKTLVSIITLIGYTILMVAIGAWAHRKIKSMSDYWVWGRSVKSVLGGLTWVATGLSAGAFMGHAGMGFRWGWGYIMALMGGFMFGNLSVWTWFGDKLRSVTRRLNVMTIPEIIEKRYDSKLARVIAALIVFFTTIPMMSGQFKGVAIVFESMLGIPYFWGVILGSISAIIYTAVGGVIAGVVTDVIQAILMWITSLVLVGFGMYVVGWGNLNAKVAEMGGRYVDPVSGFSLTFVISVLIMGGFSAICPPHHTHRLYTMASRKNIIRGGIIALITVAFWDFMGPYTGLVAKGLMSNLPDPDMAAPALIFSFVGIEFGTIICTGLLAAAMSTVDGLILMAAAAVAADVTKAVKPTISERTEMQLATMASVLVGILGVIFAFWTGPLGGMIAMMMILAFSYYGACFTVPIVGGLFWRRANKAGGLAALIVGFIATTAWYMMGSPYQIHYGAFGAIASSIAFIVVSLATPKPPEETVRKFFPEKGIYFPD